MQILNRISPKDIARLDGTIVEYAQLDEPGYLRHMSMVEETTLSTDALEDNEEDVESARFALGNVKRLVIRHFDPFNTAQKRFIYGLEQKGVEVVGVLKVLTEQQYIKALEYPVSIGISVMDALHNGVSRFNEISKLIQSGVWDLKVSHWLWELTNPAELAGYKALLSASAFQSISGVISYRCYIDSYFGIRYSSAVGILSPPLSDIPNKYRWPQQDVLYHLNLDQVRHYASGFAGTEIVEVMRKGVIDESD